VKSQYTTFFTLTIYTTTRHGRPRRSSHGGTRRELEPFAFTGGQLGLATLLFKAGSGVEHALMEGLRMVETALAMQPLLNNATSLAAHHSKRDGILASRPRASVGYRAWLITLSLIC